MSFKRRLIEAGALCSLACASVASAQPVQLDSGYQQLMRELLRRDGYVNVEFVAVDGEAIEARACSGAEFYEVTVGRDARVLDRTRIGVCPDDASRGDVPTEVIVESLYGKGFLWVDVTDAEPPTLVATACRGDREFEIRLDARGDIIDTRALGGCDTANRPPLDADQIARILFLQGYRQVRIAGDAEEGFAALACRGVREFELDITPNAVAAAREAVGFCDAADDEVAYVPPQPIERERIEGAAPLEPESCQFALDWLQYETPLTFESGSAELSENDVRLLESIARVIDRCPSTTVLVEGHTSLTGSESSNQDLSERRALSVSDMLSELGVASSRLEARGFGEVYPRVPRQGRVELNRRIEVSLEWRDG